MQVFQLSLYQGTGLDRSLWNQITDFYLFNFSSQHVGWRTDTQRGSRQGTGMGGGGSKTSVIQRDLPSHWKFSRFQDLKQRTKQAKIKGYRSEELNPTCATKGVKTSRSVLLEFCPKGLNFPCYSGLHFPLSAPRPWLPAWLRQSQKLLGTLQCMANL